jgi:divalent metal cation (Fe/Co/Zn/Cd) transporter
VGVEDTLTVQEAHLIGHHVKDAIRAGLPAVHDVLVHIEPASRHHHDPAAETAEPVVE